MTEKEFIKIATEDTFESALSQMESDYLWTTEELEQLVRDQVGHDNHFALYLLNCIWNNTSLSDYWYYDVTAGLCCELVPITSVQDVSKFIGFEEE